MRLKETWTNRRFESFSDKYAQNRKADIVQVLLRLQETHRETSMVEREDTLRWWNGYGTKWAVKCLV